MWGGRRGAQIWTSWELEAPQGVQEETPSRQLYLEVEVPGKKSEHVNGQ